MMVETRIYLDTNIVSRLVDFRVTQATADAYAALADMDGLQFVTSEKARAEVRQTTNRQKNAVLQLLVSFIEKVQHQTVEYSAAYGDAPIGDAPYGDGWTDPLFTQLRAIFDTDDAHHILDAVRSGCQFFLTLDKNTILDRVAAHRAAVTASCGALQFVAPQQLVAQLRAGS